MSGKILFSRETRHLRIVAGILLVGAAIGFGVRQQAIPASFGEFGRYRGDSLRENASFPSLFPADETCLKCHDNVREERAESPHHAVACLHCHGSGRAHIASAEAAKGLPDHPLPSAEEWDGKFPSKVDLFITQDKATCLSCHLRVVGMPEGFRSINVAEHLEEQGASEPGSRNVCFECHEGHSPGL